jgi:glycosyltransferase involved in cell wall biosynthesis
MYDVPESLKVLTNLAGGTPGQFWGEHARLVRSEPLVRLLSPVVGKKWAERLGGVVDGVRLFRLRKAYAAVVTEGGTAALVFAWLQTILTRQPHPNIVIDCLWYLPRARLGKWFKSVQIRVAARSVRTFVVWASHEVEDYPRAFGLPSNKFCYIPFFHTLDDYTYEIRDEGYLFAGGNYDRDYRTLIEAVRPLDLPVWIATTRPEQARGIRVPSHVRIEGTSQAGFRQALAGSRLVVVPMESGLLHSGGQQTCLNAMALGKPTIAVGKRWASDFIINQENGIIVEYGDSDALRQAIVWVLQNSDKAQIMASRGKAIAQQFTSKRCMNAIYDLATIDQKRVRDIPRR